jgi:hypothetical protein
MDTPAPIDRAPARPSSTIPGWDPEALARLEHALEVIGAQCAIIGLRILRGRQLPRPA